MDISQISVLIVDDEPLNCDIFSHTLKKAGYLTRALGSGRKALELMTLEKFDVVLLDINMPGIDGIQVLEQIKSNKATNDIPVMMITAEHDNETVLKCIKLGAADYIKKPVEPALLRSRLWRCLQKHKGFTGAEPSQLPDKKKTKARILIVDDDEMLRSIVQHRLVAEEHTVFQAQNGKEALEILDNNQIDLILLDVVMPELDGFQTLKNIKACNKNRHIPVIMCSADDSPDSISQCMKAGAEDYILKPFNATLLKIRVQSCLVTDANGTIKSSAQANAPDIIMDLAHRLKNDKIKFPVMPDIAIKVDKLFKEKEDISPRELADIIKTDPSLTMRLISISNNSYYRGSMAIKNLEEAIMRLGMQETQNYLLMLTNRSLFDSAIPPFNKFLHNLWIHSLATAEAARLLGKHLKYNDLNQLFTLGMLHDIGKMLLLQVLLELNDDDRDMDETNIMEIIDSLHTAFGAALMRKWNLPSEFSYTAEQHHTISEGGKYSEQFLVVCLANMITRIPGYSLKENTDDDPAQSYAARTLGIDTDTINHVIGNMSKFVSGMQNI